MGEIGTPKPVQLFCGAIYNPAAPLDNVKADLEAGFGPADFVSPQFDFDKTSYYEEEMGAGLRKIFVAFEKLIPPEKIVDVKLATNGIEEKYHDGAGGGRLVNLDPGYLALAKMALATTKDNFHRLYLGRGIFAEVTLKFENGSFHPLPWTYPDYCSDGYIDYFNQLRDSYKQKLKYNIFYP